MKFRNLVFWLHLIAGIIAGSVVMIMSVSGVLLAFEKQIVTFVDRDFYAAPAQPDAKRLSIETLLAKVREKEPDTLPTGIWLRSDLTAPAAFALGRERTIYVNPYTGSVLGEGSKKIRAFFQSVTDWHRWLAREGESRATGKAITGACNLAFLFLVISGFYLWWPRQWSLNFLKSITLFNKNLSGKARDWNWHNVIGFWSAIPLFLIVLTGVIMSYPWANNLLFRATGNEPPPPRVEGGGKERPRGKESRESRGGEKRSPAPSADIKLDHLDEFWTRTEQNNPGWKTILLRYPASAEAPLVFSIDRGGVGRPDLRSQLTLNSQTGEVISEETFASYNLGRKLRLWTRWTHTGEAGSLIGQAIAGLASLGAAFLVWTGFALSWRRFFSKKKAVSPSQP